MRLGLGAFDYAFLIPNGSTALGVMQVNIFDDTLTAWPKRMRSSLAAPIADLGGRSFPAVHFRSRFWPDSIHWRKGARRTVAADTYGNLIPQLRHIFHPLPHTHQWSPCLPHCVQRQQGPHLWFSSRVLPQAEHWHPSQVCAFDLIEPH